MYSNNGSHIGFSVSNIGVPDAWNCPAFSPSASPVALRAYNGSVETVEITLKNTAYPEQAITSLSVTLVLPIGNYTTPFARVSGSNSLQFGQVTTQAVVLPAGAMRTWTTYRMNERGTLLDGTGFNVGVAVELDG